MRRKNLCSYWIILIIFFLCQNWAVAATELEQIRQAIAAKGAQWTAGENWVTRLPLEERRRLLGAIIEPPDPARTLLLSIPVVENLPTKFDWRNNQGNWVTPVKNQGNCGSCWDFAAVGQVESWWMIHNNRPDSMIDLSEQFVLSCSEGSCDGWDPALALEFIRTVGVPGEACFKYKADDEISCDKACSWWADEAVKIPGWGYVTLDEAIVDNIKAAIYRHPITAGFEVYSDFFSYSSGVYEHVSGDLEGGHAIVIVGWNDEEQSWICKNSWAADWGENGYFRIKWGNCSIGQFSPFVWDDVSNGSLPHIAPEKIDLSLTIGDSIVSNVTLTNKGAVPLEFFSIDYEMKYVFHSDDFMSWDGLSWWCGDPKIGGYDDHWLQYLDSPILNLSQTVAPRLTWMGFWAVESPASPLAPYDGWDGCNVWISMDGGKTFHVIRPIRPKYNCQNLWSFGHPEQGWNMGLGIAGWGGSSNGWTPVEMDLSPYRSDGVIIRFAFASDLALCTIDEPNLYGFFVDEIKVADGERVIFKNSGEDDGAMQPVGFSISKADWLEIVNSAGLLPPNESTTIGCKIMTKDLSAGSYHGRIKFNFNDTTVSTLQIPIKIDLKKPLHDLMVDELFSSDRSIFILSDFDLSAKIKNNGLSDETNIDLLCTVFDGNETVYSDTSRVPLVRSDETVVVKFKPLLIPEPYVLDIQVTIINFPDDYNRFNNTIRNKVTVSNLVDSFETETGLWMFKGGWGVTKWAKAHSGNSVVHVNKGTVPYPPNMDAVMTFIPGFDISYVKQAILSFWITYSTEKDKDFLYVEVSGDNNNWVKVDSISGSGITNWIKREIGVTDFINSGYRKLWVRFRFVSDQQNSSLGVFIDDIEIYAKMDTDILPTTSTSPIPKTYELAQNYPNPFNKTTRISYTLPQSGEVNITIYNMSGQEVRNLWQAYQAPGQYSVTWDGCDSFGFAMGSGVYFCRLEVRNNFSTTRKMILMK